MQQIRLFASVSSADAPHAASILENRLEDDGYAVSAFETDEKTGRWAVSAYVPLEDVEKVAELFADVLRQTGLNATIERETIGERDWVTETLKGLKPVYAGRYVVHGSHDAGIARSNEIPILIDAGQAFGTGHHGTTAGCLEMLGRCLKSRRFSNALDLGTGSGVLAIALARSLPAHVLATDIDPVAVAVARQNVRINQVISRIRCATSAGFSRRVFTEAGRSDLVLANILARPLEQMATEMGRHLAPGATVILSGLLPHQRARILARFRGQGLAHTQTHYRDGWMTLVLEKRRPKMQRAGLASRSL